MTTTEQSTTASRYLANQLADAERVEYEALLTQSAAALAELEATARLKVGLASLRDKHEVPGLLAPPLHPIWKYLLPLAACVTALYIGTSLWSGNHSRAASLISASVNSLVDDFGHVLPVAATTAMYHRRGGTADAVIELPASRGILEWRVAPPPNFRSHHFDVVLERMHDDDSLDFVGRSDGLPADCSGVVEWFADSSRLVPWRYRLTVAQHVRWGQPEKPETFLINVRVGAKK